MILALHKFRFLTCLQVTDSGFIISANIDDHKAIQVCGKQPLAEKLLRYKLITGLHLWVLINKLNYLMEIDCHLLVFYIPA